MRREFACALNGVELNDVDERIYIEDIREETTYTNETAKRAGYGIFPLSAPEPDSMQIRVTLHIKAKDLTERMSVLQEILGWATQGWFTRSQRPFQRIYVYCTKPPTVTSERSTRFEITFTAMGEACWQDTAPVTVSVTTAAASGTKTITPLGTRDCFLEAEITPSSGTLTSVSLTVGTQFITLDGLSVAGGTTLKLYYDELHLLRMEAGGVSVADKRTAASSDHIRLKPRTAQSVAVAFSRACTYKLIARGLWR